MSKDVTKEVCESRDQETGNKMISSRRTTRCVIFVTYMRVSPYRNSAPRQRSVEHIRFALINIHAAGALCCGHSCVSRSGSGVVHARRGMRAGPLALLCVAPRGDNGRERVHHVVIKRVETLGAIQHELAAAVAVHKREHLRRRRWERRKVYAGAQGKGGRGEEVCACRGRCRAWGR